MRTFRFLYSLSLNNSASLLLFFDGGAVTKLMEMHGDNTVEDVGMEVEREDEGVEETAEE